MSGLRLRNVVAAWVAQEISEIGSFVGHVFNVPVASTLKTCSTSDATFDSTPGYNPAPLPPEQVRWLSRQSACC